MLLRLPHLFLSRRQPRLFALEGHECGIQPFLRHDPLLEQAARPSERQFGLSQSGLLLPQPRAGGLETSLLLSHHLGNTVALHVEQHLGALSGLLADFQRGRGALDLEPRLLDGQRQFETQFLRLLRDALGNGLRLAQFHEHVVLVQAHQHLILAHPVALGDQHLQHLGGHHRGNGVGVHADLGVVGIHVHQTVQEKEFLQGQAEKPDGPDDQDHRGHEQIRPPQGAADDSHRASRPHSRPPASSALLQTVFVVIVDVLRDGAQQEIDHCHQSGHKGKGAEQQEEDTAQMQVPAVGVDGLSANEGQEEADDGTASGVEPHGTCPRLHGIPGSVLRFFLLGRTELDEVAESDNVAKGNNVGEQRHQ